MRIISSAAAMQRLAKRWRRARAPIALVPTMGYLHAGHISLVRQARRRVGNHGRVVVSIYVNPTQFGPSEDLAKYPRNRPRDCKMCRMAGVDAVFMPDDTQMYPGGRMSKGIWRMEGGRYSTYVVEVQLASVMEGASRPAHFRGVTTVVAKLFNLVLPDVAVFGQKDFQQAAIIERMVRDLNFPVRLVVAPTFREPDGLAMSSRNKYLDDRERAEAVILFQVLQAAKAIVRETPVPAARLKSKLREMLSATPRARLDYMEFFDPATLQPLHQVKRGAHMALAVFFGKTRLIDNARL